MRFSSSWYSFVACTLYTFVAIALVFITLGPDTTDLYHDVSLLIKYRISHAANDDVRAAVRFYDLEIVVC